MLPHNLDLMQRYQFVQFRGGPFDRDHYVYPANEEDEREEAQADNNLFLHQSLL
jgi:hypothetical protein